MKKFFLLTSSILLLLMACSKDNDLKDLNDQKVAARASNDPFFGKNDIVHITSSGFSPAYLEIKVNSVVVWVNDDNVIHTVTSPEGKFDSGDIPPGGAYRHLFEAYGTYNYFCKYHNIEGTVIPGGVK